MDVISDILRTIRFHSVVYFQSDFAAPWGMAMDAGKLAQFHLVVRGQCWLQTDDATDPIPLAAGDVIIFPHGAAHRLSDIPGRDSQPGPAVLAAYKDQMPMFQGDANCTTLICGHFEFDRTLRHPFIRQLPYLIQLRGAESYGRSWLETAASLLIRETKSTEPGTGVIVDRLAEILFIQVLRAYSQRANTAGVYWASFRDPEINRALQLIHEEPQANWTLDRISQQVGLSRATFANRFKKLVGMPPKQYITSWRMQKAYALLRDSTLPLFAIAQRVGYSSEAAFNRAFKREFQQNPGAMRKALVTDANGKGS